jgi:hypothetical protein
MSNPSSKKVAKRFLSRKLANRFLIARNQLGSGVVVYEDMADADLRKVAKENGILGFEEMGRSVLIHTLKKFTS